MNQTKNVILILPIPYLVQWAPLHTIRRNYLRFAISTKSETRQLSISQVQIQNGDDDEWQTTRMLS